MAGETVGWTIVDVDRNGLVVSYSFMGRAVVQRVDIDLNVRPEEGQNLPTRAAIAQAIVQAIPLAKLIMMHTTAHRLVGRSGNFPAPQFLINNLPVAPPPPPPDPPSQPPEDI